MKICNCFLRLLGALETLSIWSGFLVNKRIYEIWKIALLTNLEKLRS